MVGVALVNEQVKHGINEIRRDPRVRHVTNETRLPGVPSNDLGPLEPLGGAATGEEELKQVSRPIAPAEANEGGYIAQLVGRVIVPVTAAIAPVLEFVPITLVG